MTNELNIEPQIDARNESAGKNRIEKNDRYDFDTFLGEELASRRNKNSRFSLRAFAASLGMDPSDISKIINGKRKVGAKTIFQICDRLEISDEITIQLLRKNILSEE